MPLPSSFLTSTCVQFISVPTLQVSVLHIRYREKTKLTGIGNPTGNTILLYYDFSLVRYVIQAYVFFSFNWHDFDTYDLDPSSYISTLYQNATQRHE